MDPNEIFPASSILDYVYVKSLKEQITHLKEKLNEAEGGSLFKKTLVLTKELCDLQNEQKKIEQARNSELAILKEINERLTIENRTFRSRNDQLELQVAGDAARSRDAVRFTGLKPQSDVIGVSKTIEDSETEKDLLNTLENLFTQNASLTSELEDTEEELLICKAALSGCEKSREVVLKEHDILKQN